MVSDYYLQQENYRYAVQQCSSVSLSSWEKHIAQMVIVTRKLLSSLHDAFMSSYHLFSHFLLEIYVFHYKNISTLLVTVYSRCNCVTVYLFVTAATRCCINKKCFSRLLFPGTVSCFISRNDSSHHARETDNSRRTKWAPGQWFLWSHYKLVKRL